MQASQEFFYPHNSTSTNFSVILFVMATWLGDWNFLNAWWWRPILEPLIGLGLFTALIAAGVVLYFFVFRTAELSEYRETLFPDVESPLPSDDAAMLKFMEATFPEVSEEEIAEMEEILEDVMREDIHPEMARQIEERGIPVRLMTLPTPDTVRDVGTYPVAVWIPALNTIEIYASLVKEECEGKPACYRRLMGELLLHEIGHALGLGESEVKDFGV